MLYKTSFNGLQIETKGVYSAYNLTPDELECFRRYFHGNINGSGSNWTSFDTAERHVWLKLLVHNVWIPIRFDIREDLLKITSSKRIYEKDIQMVSERMKNQRLQLRVLYDNSSNKYSICEQDWEKFWNLLKIFIEK